MTHATETHATDQKLTASARAPLERPTSGCSRRHGFERISPTASNPTKGKPSGQTADTGRRDTLRSPRRRRGVRARHDEAMVRVAIRRVMAIGRSPCSRRDRTCRRHPNKGGRNEVRRSCVRPAHGFDPYRRAARDTAFFGDRATIEGLIAGAGTSFNQSCHPFPDRTSIHDPCRRVSPNPPRLHTGSLPLRRR